MSDPGLLLLHYPFVLTLAAGALAGVSAILLRRASAVVGPWLTGIALLLVGAATLAFSWSFYWAWTIVEPTQNAGFPVLAAMGWFAILGGGALAVKALSVRGMGALRSWPAARVESRSPYRHIRRPIAAALSLGALGATLIVDTVPAYACLALAALLLHALLELADWELKSRFPESRDYIKRTPRYIPRLRRKRAARG